MKRKSYNAIYFADRYTSPFKLRLLDLEVELSTGYPTVLSLIVTDLPLR
jgi:hypothetical protein